VASERDCIGGTSRDQLYALGLAGDRVVWSEKGWGLCFFWTTREATIGSAPVTLGNGNGCLGLPLTDGLGTAVGSGALLVQSHWTMRTTNGAPAPDEQTIERVDAGGCPCPPLATNPGLYVPLDVDQNRIVVGSATETRVLASDGTVLLSLDVPTLAAQLSGSDLVLAAGGQLRVYDAATGTLRHSWPLPAQTAGHDCDYYGDPSCQSPPTLTLGDVAHGLAAYVLDGQVHLLRLSDGAETIVGSGTHARFADTGLVFADGARIRLLAFAQLPLAT
jgi:hypothetical protein